MCALLDFAKLTLKCLNTLYFEQLALKHFHRTSSYSKTTFSVISNKNLHTSSVFYKSNDVSISNKPAAESNTSKPEKKKKEKLTYITLIAPNSHVTVTTLEDATKLAVRRDLKLIKVKDYRTQVRKDRPTYQLMTTAQFLQEEKKGRTLDNESNKSNKGTKLLSVSSKINDHDINSKIKNIIRWLEKQNEVRIVISNDNGEAESVYDKIAEQVKESGKIVQKREKGLEIRFQILPLTKNTATVATSKSSD